MQVLPSQNDALAVANSNDSFTMFYLAKIMPSATAMFFFARPKRAVNQRQWRFSQSKVLNE